MGEKMKLKVKALRILQADLHRDEMVAIYLMQFGTDLPPNLAKHLTKIVRLLCKKLDWIDDRCDPPGPSINYFSVFFWQKMIYLPFPQRGGYPFGLSFSITFSNSFSVSDPERAFFILRGALLGPSNWHCRLFCYLEFI